MLVILANEMETGLNGAHYKAEGFVSERIETSVDNKLKFSVGYRENIENF